MGLPKSMVGSAPVPAARLRSKRGGTKVSLGKTCRYPGFQGSHAKAAKSAKRRGVRIAEIGMVESASGYKAITTAAH
jgi:hypothetical protein